MQSNILPKLIKGKT